MLLEKSIIQEVSNTTKSIHKHLDYYSSSLYLKGAPLKSIEAIRYSLLSEGKKLRSFLVLSTAKLLGVDMNVIIPAACAVEILHVSSLIHDDLPAMDNDDYRRGIPTNHKVFGEATAILTGDALISLAYQVITECDIESRLIVKCIKEMSSAIGASGLVGGQQLDLDAENKLLSIEQIKQINKLKTSSLFCLSLRIGAIIGKADDDVLQLLTSYGEKLGLAYQIKDDILGALADFEDTGKSDLSDESLGKANFIRLYGLEKAQLLAQQEVDTAINLMKPFSEEGHIFCKLAQYILDRKK